MLVAILPVVVFTTLFILRQRWAHPQRRARLFDLVLLAAVTSGQTISLLLNDSPSSVVTMLTGVMWLCVIGLGIEVWRHRVRERSR